MSQNLELINKGHRNAPTTYKFGSNERLNIHYQDRYADLTDATTGACVRRLGWDGVRNMGYSPAKLLAGNETDQLIDTGKPTLIQHTLSCAKYIAGGLVAALALAMLGNVTGCNGFLANQLEQDVATSTSYKSLADEQALAKFREQNALANKKLAEMNLYATGGDQ